MPGEHLGSDSVKERWRFAGAQIPLWDPELAQNSLLHVDRSIMQHGVTQKCQMDVFPPPVAHSSNSWQLVNKSNNQKAVRETWKAKCHTERDFLPLRVITGRPFSGETSASLSPLSGQLLLCYCCSGVHPSHVPSRYLFELAVLNL